MSTCAYRFVGQERLPSRLPDIDLDQFFQLTDADIAAVTDRFRADRRVAGALQLLFLRAMGRPMSQPAVVPRNLLKYVTVALKASPLSIASLRSLYERAPTLYEHQNRAKKYLGIRDFDTQAGAAVVSLLQVLSTEASHKRAPPAAPAGCLKIERYNCKADKIIRSHAQRFDSHQPASAKAGVVQSVSSKPSGPRLEARRHCHPEATRLRPARPCSPSGQDPGADRLDPDDRARVLAEH